MKRTLACAFAAALVAPFSHAAALDAEAAGWGLDGVKRPSADIPASVPAAPAHGAHFTFKLTDAPQTGPQAAVFLNGMLQGIIQLWGTSPAAVQYKWRKTYSLYIPPNAFKPGANVVTVALAPPMWSDKSEEVMRRFWFKWEDVRLDALSAPPRDTLHGKAAYIGTTMKQDAGFRVDDASLALIDAALPWIGAAYSGNTMRADFWHDVASQQPRRREYLEKLRDYNCTVLADNISGHFHIDAAGGLSAAGKAVIAKFFSDYGDLIQYYELGNEPCMFGGAYADYLATARHIYSNRPPHMLLAATGWAFGGGKGEPVNWDADPARRRAVESWCDMMNGHSYGNSYNEARGGSFMENFKTYGEIEDGWPKEFIVSETGANDWHSEENGPRYPSRAPHASAFDRIIRAHVAVADRVMQHALVFDDFGLFNRNGGGVDFKSTLVPRPGPGGEPPRLSTFRRIALAYATHGRPLEYEILNAADLKNRLVYVRAVDTLAIAPQPGSGATADKILVNLVNFEDRQNAVSVRVKMPASGGYAALRIGDGADYASAHKQIAALKADPWLAFTDTLAPGEGVQYIISADAPRARPAEWAAPAPVKRLVRKPPAAPALSAPAGLRAFGLGASVVVDFIETDGADLYFVERSENGGAFAPLSAGWGGAAKITDRAVKPGARYEYRVRAKNEQHESRPSEPVRITLEKGGALAGWTDAGIGSGARQGGCLATADGSLIALTGAGHDIWAEKDGLRFLYKKVGADATLVARAPHFDRTHQYMKVGLMARISEDESSPMAIVAHSAQSTVFNWRAEQAGGCGQTGAPVSQWLKLERRGAKLAGYCSPDGTLWRKVGEADLPAAAAGAQILMGLGVCSHSERAATAFFDNVSLQQD